VGAREEFDAAIAAKSTLALRARPNAESAAVHLGRVLRAPGWGRRRQRAAPCPFCGREAAPRGDSPIALRSSPSPIPIPAGWASDAIIRNPPATGGPRKPLGLAAPVESHAQRQGEQRFRPGDPIRDDPPLGDPIRDDPPLGDPIRDDPPLEVDHPAEDHHQDPRVTPRRMRACLRVRSVWRQSPAPPTLSWPPASAHRLARRSANCVSRLRWRGRRAVGDALMRAYLRYV